MPPGTGLGAALGLAEEVTFGTFAPPARWLEFNSESLDDTREPIESAGIRRGSRTQRVGRRRLKPKGGAGDVELEIPAKRFGVVLKHMLGQLVTTTPGGGALTRDHTATIGDIDGKSLSLQKLVPLTSGTVTPYSFRGAKIPSWEMSVEVDGFLTASLATDAREVVTSDAAGTPAYAALDEVFDWSQLQATIDGTAVCIRGFSFAADNALATDRYFMCSATGSLKKAQLEAGNRAYTGSIMLDYEDAAYYTKYAANTLFPLVIDITGSLIEAGFNFGLQITLPKIHLDGATPQVGGMEVVPHELPFTVLDDGVSSPVTIRYRNDETTP